MAIIALLRLTRIKIIENGKISKQVLKKTSNVIEVYYCLLSHNS